VTNLDERPVKRETREIDSTRSGRRRLIVLLEVGGKLLRIKPKGTRRWFSVSYADVYRLAVKAYATELRQRTAEERKARKAVRA
jgi:hypothetical protein